MKGSKCDFMILCVNLSDIMCIHPHFPHCCGKALMVVKSSRSSRSYTSCYLRMTKLRGVCEFPQECEPKHQLQRLQMHICEKVEPARSRVTHASTACSQASIRYQAGTVQAQSVSAFMQPCFILEFQSVLSVKSVKLPHGDFEALHVCVCACACVQSQRFTHQSRSALIGDFLV